MCTLAQRLALQPATNHVVIHAALTAVTGLEEHVLNSEAYIQH